MWAFVVWLAQWKAQLMAVALNVVKGVVKGAVKLVPLRVCLTNQPMVQGLVVDLVKMFEGALMTVQTGMMWG